MTLKGIKRRIQCWSWGIFYFSSSDYRIPTRLRVSGKMHQLKFRNADDGAFRYEFSEICFSDCYRLALLKQRLGNIKSIVDIGANQGLFLVAARNRWPNAAIWAYEPNPHIKEVVSWNAEALGAHFFQEAVTRNDSRMDLTFSDSDLHTTAQVSSTGAVTGTAFQKVVERAGGRIDVLKIDCEGGEWSMFEDEESWRWVRGLTMEYHLWAREGSTVEDIKNILEKLGFIILSLDELTDSYGLVTAVKG